MAGMMPADVVSRLLAVPYAPGEGAWTGADCWGVVELWYRHVLGIDLKDRADRPPGHNSVQGWADEGLGWISISAPEDHCLVLMRAGRLSAGHVGVFYNGRVLHSAKSHGCVFQPLSDRIIRSSITGFLRKS